MNGAQQNQKKNNQAEFDTDVSMATHVFLVLCVAVCVLFLFWATFFKLDIISSAAGDVFPSTKIKKVQHLEGGIVKEIRIKEGQNVKKGDALVILESTASFADVAQLKIKIATLETDIIRLTAELNDEKELVFPEKFKAHHPELVKEALNTFRLRNQRQQAEIKAQVDQTVQNEQQIKEVSARLGKLKEELELSQEQIAISEDLLKEDLTNRYNHIELLRDSKNIESRIEEDSAVLKRAEAALGKESSTLDAIKANFHEEAAKDLEEKKRELAELTEKLEKFKDSLKRTVLISPVEGVVKQLNVASTGEVVKPGETVLDILPSGDRLIIDARLPIKDIGYIKLGQTAMIRLASNEAMRFDHLDGTVTNISPDAIHPDEGEPYYRVTIETDKSHFSRGPLRYKLFPGMQVTANIRTGKRTVITYLLDPFFGSFNEALTEQ